MPNDKMFIPKPIASRAAQLLGRQSARRRNERMTQEEQTAFYKMMSDKAIKKKIEIGMVKMENVKDKNTINGVQDNGIQIIKY